MTEDRSDDPSADDPHSALDARARQTDARRFSPSIARNRDAVRAVFLQHMLAEGTLLEIASGTGEHGAHIAPGLPGLDWWYSDIDADGRASQAAWASHLGPGAGLKGPLRIDVSAGSWGEADALAPFDAMFCANMLHIAPFAAAQGLMAGAGQRLRQGGRMMVYGPFARHGEMAPSNQRFSDDLKSRDPDWGVRDLDREIGPLARAAGLALVEVVEMPANNLSVIFERE
ncbi:MAG: DUF938 domain-containing protein [Alphaproteobacteria bacterium]|jgi:hypothetical protein|nr:DUF938 domain-containing protein [Alphaproteobacteria bacterium]